jgi:hypothetical protein
VLRALYLEQLAAITFIDAQVDFAVPGSSYRGDSSIGRLHRVDPDAIFEASSKSARVTINSLRLDNVNDAQLVAQKFVLKVSLHDEGHQLPCASNYSRKRSKRMKSASAKKVYTLLKLKGPRTIWKADYDDDGADAVGDDGEFYGGGNGISQFMFDTGHHSVLHFDLIDKRGFMCFGAAHSRGVHRFPFRQVCHSDLPYYA